MTAALIVLAAAALTPSPGATAVATARAEILRPASLRDTELHADHDAIHPAERMRDCGVDRPARCRLIVYDLP